jgi:ABC-type glycerol-3-phosphate transport system permease component
MAQKIIALVVILGAIIIGLCGAYAISKKRTHFGLMLLAIMWLLIAVYNAFILMEV